MTNRVVRSKARIAVLVDRIVEVMAKYPELSVNAVATAGGWTQSSFQRACQSREVVVPQAGRKSIENLVAEFGMARDFDAISNLLDSIEYIREAQTMEIAEEQVQEAEVPVATDEDLSDDEDLGDDEDEDEEVDY